MKAKTIKSIISKKFKEFASSIEDEKVRGLVEKNTIVTGGCIASMLLGEPVNDFDLYFRNRETVIAVAEYYVKRFEKENAHKRKGVPIRVWVDYGDGECRDPDLAKGEGGDKRRLWSDDRVRIVVKSAGAVREGKQEYQYYEYSDDGRAEEYAAGVIDDRDIETIQDPGSIEDTYEATEAEALGVEEGEKFRPVFLSTNAITLSHKVQIVLRFFGEPADIHSNYDFVHCTNYWTSWDKDLVLNQPALQSLLAKELVYVGSKYPICSMFRVRKFVRRGWTINAGQMLKMAMQISELDLTSVAVLEDQLTGVDVAYFGEVISKIQEKDPEKVNAAYLVEIIDRMF